jgi:hypothetical protein
MLRWSIPSTRSQSYAASMLGPVEVAGMGIPLNVDVPLLLSAYWAIPMTITDCSSALSMEEDSNDDSNGTSECEGDVLVNTTKRRVHQKAVTCSCSSADGEVKSSHEVHCGQIPTDARSVCSDADENDILDGIWPGSHDIQLVTRFVISHFSGEWTAYHHFAKWADSRVLTHPGITTWLDDWPHTKSGKTRKDKSVWGIQQSTDAAFSGSAGEWQRNTEVAGTWYHLGSPGGIDTDNNMYNKSCIS